MIDARKWTFRTALVAATMTAGLAVGASSAAMAQTASLAGSWSGGGRVIYPSGDSERVRCRATFRPAGLRTFRMSAICATPAARIAQMAQVRRVSASSYTGQFINREHDISGTINITVRGSRLSAALTGGGGRAIMTLSR
jgi:hypothetical protein